MDAFPYDGDGIARETSIEDSQEPVADQGQIGQEGSVSAPRAVLSHECIPPPMVAVFNAGPMASDQLQPLFWRPILRFETADVMYPGVRPLSERRRKRRLIRDAIPLSVNTNRS